MLNFRTGALLQQPPVQTPFVPPHPPNQAGGQLLQFRSPAPPSVRRRLSPQAGRALEILSHAIEYLADEYAADPHHSGPLGSADPRVKAIQVLKTLNRSVYYSGTQVQPAFRRIRRWFIGIRLARPC